MVERGSLDSAYPSVRAMQGRAQIVGEEIITDATRRWARTKLPRVNQQQIVLYNPTPVPWQGVVEAEPFLDFDSWGDRWISDLAGRPVPFQKVRPEAGLLVSRIAFPAQVAAGSFTQLLVRDDARPAEADMPADLQASDSSISNRFLQMRLTASGIGGIAFQGREMLGANGLSLHLRDDHSNSWGAGSDRFSEPIRSVFSGDGWIMDEAGPLRARAHVETRLGGSPVTWQVTLHAGDPRLYLHIETVFGERHMLLQMPIDLAEAPARWTSGMAGGMIERVPSATEWPVQGWSRLEAGGLAMTVVTADAYSASLDGTRWQWSLLRTPKMAWGGHSDTTFSGCDAYADHGRQVFDVVLRFGDELHAETLDGIARQQVQCPVIFDRYEGMNRPAYGNHPPRHVLTGSELRAAARNSADASRDSS